MSRVREGVLGISRGRPNKPEQDGQLPYRNETRLLKIYRPLTYAWQLVARVSLGIGLT